MKKIVCFFFMVLSVCFSTTGLSHSLNRAVLSPSDMTRLVNDLIRYNMAASDHCVQVSIPNYPKKQAIEMFPGHFDSLLQQSSQSCSAMSLLQSDRGLLTKFEGYMKAPGGTSKPYYALIIDGFTAQTTVNIQSERFEDDLGTIMGLYTENSGWVFSTGSNVEVVLTQ